MTMQLNIGEPAPELSRPIPIDRVGGAWQNHRITTTEVERAALAERFDLLALPGLTGLIKVKRVRGGRYLALEGSFEARASQTCVVTLEPIELAYADDFNLLLGPLDGRTDDALREIDLATLEDEPEPFSGTELDIGEILAQHFSLVIDPYPRSPDAVPAAPVQDQDAPEEPVETEKPNPFAALAKLRQKD